MNDFQKFIAYSRYARYIPELQRRETFEETVNRLITFLDKKLEGTFPATLEDIRKAILNLEIMPSMRLLMTSGEAAERDNIAIYN